MKIIFVSHLSDAISVGPNWSVPAGISAQETIDEVLWLNISGAHMPHWDGVKAYTQAAEWGKDPQLGKLPGKFRRPDAVVFEGIYFLPYVKFAKELRKKGIPYIIIPRGSLTLNARRHYSRWKKLIAHKLFFDRFCNNALAIQYLTEVERLDSAHNWKSGQFVIPNGFTTPKAFKTNYSANGINAVFIGRPSLYHKGIDLLFGAMAKLKEKLDAAGFRLRFYSPYRLDRADIEKLASDLGINSLIDFQGEISGKEKEEAILGSDLFVLTSRFEGHPMGLIEALAYGLPAMVTTGSNMREEIEQSDAGWTADTTLESVADALEKIMQEAGRLKSKGENARRLAAGYDWKILADRLHYEITKLI